MTVFIEVTTHSVADCRSYKVTSGGEIRLPKELADRVESAAKKRIANNIRFRIATAGETDFQENIDKANPDDSDLARKRRLCNAPKKPDIKTELQIPSGCLKN